MTHTDLEHIHHCRTLRDLCVTRDGAPVPVYLHRPSGNQFCLLRLQGDWVLASVNARGVRRADMSGWEIRELPALFGAYVRHGTTPSGLQWGVIVDWRWSKYVVGSCLDDRDISGEYEAYQVLSRLLNLRHPAIRTRSDLLK